MSDKSHWWKWVGGEEADPEHKAQGGGDVPLPGIQGIVQGQKAFETSKDLTKEEWVDKVLDIMKSDIGDAGKALEYQALPVPEGTKKKPDFGQLKQLLEKKKQEQLEHQKYQELMHQKMLEEMGKPPQAKSSPWSDALNDAYSKQSDEWAKAKEYAQLKKLQEIFGKEGGLQSLDIETEEYPEIPFEYKPFEFPISYGKNKATNPAKKPTKLDKRCPHCSRELSRDLLKNVFFCKNDECDFGMVIGEKELQLYGSPKDERTWVGTIMEVLGMTYEDSYPEEQGKEEQQNEAIVATNGQWRSVVLKDKDNRGVEYLTIPSNRVEWKIAMVAGGFRVFRRTNEMEDHREVWREQ